MKVTVIAGKFLNGQPLSLRCLSEDLETVKENIKNSVSDGSALDPDSLTFEDIEMEDPEYDRIVTRVK